MRSQGPDCPPSTTSGQGPHGPLAESVVRPCLSRGALATVRGSMRTAEGQDASLTVCKQGILMLNKWPRNGVGNSLLESLFLRVKFFDTLNLSFNPCLNLRFSIRQSQETRSCLSTHLLSLPFSHGQQIFYWTRPHPFFLLSFLRTSGPPPQKQAGEVTLIPSRSQENGLWRKPRFTSTFWR